MADTSAVSVHVVDRIEDIDHVSGTRLVSRFDYHDGYFDGVEREFRGFGMVEQHDAESFEDFLAGIVDPGGAQDADPEIFAPPVTTRTWNHTGAFLEGDRVLHHRRDAYNQGRPNTSPTRVSPRA